MGRISYCQACRNNEYGVRTRLSVDHTCNKTIDYTTELDFLTDGKRHLICIPYSIENLHIMADRLFINRCHYHYKNKKTGKIRPHYDIPVFRMDEILRRCKLVNMRDIVNIIKDNL